MTVGIADGEKWVADTAVMNVYEYRDSLSQEIPSHSGNVICIQGKMIKLPLILGIALEKFHVLLVIYLHERSRGFSVRAN